METFVAFVKHLPLAITMSSSAILQQLVTPGFRAGVYAGNALWHSMAFANFTFRPEYMLKKLTTRKNLPETKATPGGDLWHQGEYVNVVKMLLVSHNRSQTCCVTSVRSTPATLH